MLSSLSDPLTGETDTYAYNDMDQVSSITYGTGGDVQTYQYTPLAQVASDTISNGSTTVGSISYGYDAEGALTSKTDQDAVANTYGYDEAWPTSWDTPTTDTAYGYDADSNRTSITTTSVATGAVTGTATSQYDARDELESSATTPASGPATTTDYAYTASGTLTSAGGTAATFDAFGDQLSSGADSFTYDALGRVVSRTRGSSTADLSYDGVTNQLASDGTGDDYVYDASGSLVSASIGGTDADLWTDAHTDVVGDFTSTGTTLSGTTEYDPLGNVLSQAGNASGVSAGYQSGYTDSATGGVDMDARWYTPASGQFTSADTVQNSAAPDPASANPFGYADGSPLDSTDPSGHDGAAAALADTAAAEEAEGPLDATPVGWVSSAATLVVGLGIAAWLEWGSSGSSSPASTYDVTEPCGEGGGYGSCGAYYDTSTVNEPCGEGGGYGSCGAYNTSGGSRISGRPVWGSGTSTGGGCDAACQDAIAAARAAAIALALLHQAEHASTEGRTHINPVTKINTPILTGGHAIGIVVTTGTNDSGDSNPVLLTALSGNSNSSGYGGPQFPAPPTTDEFPHSNRWPSRLGASLLFGGLNAAQTWQAEHQDGRVNWWSVAGSFGIGALGTFWASNISGESLWKAIGGYGGIGAGGGAVGYLDNQWGTGQRITSSGFWCNVRLGASIGALSGYAAHWTEPGKPPALPSQEQEWEYHSSRKFQIWSVASIGAYPTNCLRQVGCPLLVMVTRPPRRHPVVRARLTRHYEGPYAAEFAESVRQSLRIVGLDSSAGRGGRTLAQLSESAIPACRVLPR